MACANALSFARDDRFIIASLGISVIGSYFITRTVLGWYRDETKIKPAEPKTQYITQDTEDSLEESTLDALLTHYNYAIRETAAKIVCDRAVNDCSTIETLLVGLTSSEYETRIKNLRCLAIITDQHTLQKLHNWKAYTALIRSLEYCLEDGQVPLTDPHFDSYYLRDMAEKLCLMFVSQLVLRYDAVMLVKAHFVEKWLAKQDWGVTLSERETNFRVYTSPYTNPNRIQDIIDRIAECSVGRRALEAAGLPTAQFNLSTTSPTACQCPHHRRQRGMVPEQLGDCDSVEDVGENGNMRLGTLVGIAHAIVSDGEDGHDEVSTATNRRSFEQSAEEQRLRHRHREAMVFNDGSRPVNSLDIIQRDLDSPT